MRVQKALTAILKERQVSRVFILRPDNLGDVVLFSGALRHIRKHYPEADITICVKRYVRPLLELCPHIDHIVEWERVSAPLLDRYPFLRQLRGGVRLDRCLRPVTNYFHQTDILLVPVRSPTGGLYGMHAAAGSIPARQRIGVAGDYCNQTQEEDEAAERVYSLRLHLPPERDKEHEFYVTRDYLKLLGIDLSSEDLWPEFWTATSDRHWAKGHIPRNAGEVTLAISPGVTSLPGKFYPAEKYALVLSELKELKISVVLFGSAAEKAQCEEVAQALACCRNIVSIVNLSGRTTIRELVEGLHRCDAVLTQETAALHIATALCKPTVGIIGGGHYGRFYPWGDAAINRVAHVPMDCYWCNWRCRYDSIRCIQEISANLISRELRSAIAAAAEQHPTDKSQ